LLNGDLPRSNGGGIGQSRLFIVRWEKVTRPFLRKDGKNVTSDKAGKLSGEARRLIGGLCQFAPSLTAFGNTVASSYLRLIPH